MRTRLNIPVDIAPVLFKNNLRKPFQVFCALKLLGYSRISDLKGALSKCEPVVGYKYRTIKKHFNALLKLGWIGSDGYGNYWLRKMNYLRCRYRSDNKRMISITLGEVKKIDEIITSAFLANATQNQETLRWIYRNKKNKSQVSIIKDDAGQRDEFLSSINYSGMSSNTIGKKLGTSRSTAKRILQRANQAGYIKVNEKKECLMRNRPYKDILAAKKSGAFENEKLIVEETTKSKKNKLNFYRKFNLYKQLHNEIIPQIEMKKRNDWIDYSKGVKGVELYAPLS